MTWDDSKLISRSPGPHSEAASDVAFKSPAHRRGASALDGL